MKAAASSVKNTRAFEVSVLSRVIVEQARQMQSSPADRGLPNPSPAEPALLQALGVGSAFMGKVIRWDGLQLGAGDLIFFGGRAGFVCCGVEAEGRALVLVDPLARVSVAPSSSTWALQPHEPVLAIDLGEVDVALPYCWTPTSSSEWRALHR